MAHQAYTKFIYNVLHPNTIRNIDSYMLQHCWVDWEAQFVLLEVQVMGTLPAPLTVSCVQQPCSLAELIFFNRKKTQNKVTEKVATLLKQTTFGVTRLFLFIPSGQIHLNMLHIHKLWYLDKDTEMALHIFPHIILYILLLILKLNYISSQKRICHYSKG